MNIYLDNGAHVETDDFNIVIDPTKKFNDADLVLISHAHSDHYAKSYFKTDHLKIMSQETLEIINMRNKNGLNKVNNYKIIKESEEFKFGKNDEIKITAYNAGHCGGSLQFLIEIKDRKIIYTGDFCLENRLGLKRGDLLKGTDLIIDATYFDKKYQFPSRNQVYTEILKYIKYRMIDKKQDFMIIFGRELGTCQEMTSLLNYCVLKKDYNIKILTHPSVFDINTIHSNYCEDLGEFEYINHDWSKNFEIDPEILKNGKAIYLAPMFLSFKSKIEQFFSDYDRNNFMVVTGWALNQSFRLKGFPLTSHGDYNQIMYYKEKSKAENVHFK